MRFKLLKGLDGVPGNLVCKVPADHKFRVNLSLDGAKAFVWKRDLGEQIQEKELFNLSLYHLTLYLENLLQFIGNILKSYQGTNIQNIFKIYHNLNVRSN